MHATDASYDARNNARMTVIAPSRNRLHRWALTAACIVAMSLIPSAAPAQEALRMSLVGADAAEARRKALLTPGFYNLQLGPTTWRMNAGLSLEYNDNIHLRETNVQSDAILAPRFGLNMLWPVTDRNALNLSMESGYSLYLSHNDLSRLFVKPGSEFAWDIYVGDFMINVHERFSLTETAYENPTVTGTGKYALMDNALGINVLGDLNKVVLFTGFDHINYDIRGVPSADNDAQIESWYATLGWRVRPDMELGAEGGASLIDFREDQLPDATQLHAGLYYKLLLSSYLHLKLHGGYTLYSPEDTARFKSLPDKETWYADAIITHRLNKAVTYSATFGHVVNMSFHGYHYELSFVHIRPRLTLIKDTTLTLPLFFERGRWLYQVYGLGYAGEQFDRYGAGVYLSRKLSKRLDARCGWEFIKRDSTLQNADYQVNRFTLSMLYNF